MGANKFQLLAALHCVAQKPQEQLCGGIGIPASYGHHCCHIGLDSDTAMLVGESQEPGGIPCILQYP